MLREAFAKAVYPEGSEKEHEIIKKIFENTLAGNLCTTIEDVFLPESIVAENPLESLPETPLCRLGNSYYLQKNWVFETRIVQSIKNLLNSEIEKIEHCVSDTLNEEQKEAVALALTQRLSLITGGPGTGKTYTAIQLVQSFLAKKPAAKVVLAAPTGKAVSRLEKAFDKDTRVLARTLHSLLRISQNTAFVEEEGVWIDADFILVDECSMIDAALFSYFLSSIPKKARVVLMGDADQLPPVETGSLFADLIDSKQVPYVRLKTSLRSNQQEILSLAQAAKEGNVNEILKTISPCDLWKEIEAHFPGPVSTLPSDEELLNTLERFKILSCIRKGPKGVDTLNEAIYRHFLAKMQPGLFLAIPIMITKNDQSLRLFNGDIGVLIRQFNNFEYAYFNGKRLPLAMLPPFEYAYALSVHKSQGSEYEKVLLLVPKGSENFGRQVLYTAITRAKQSILIDADMPTIQAALDSNSTRASNLAQRLQP